MTPWHLCLTCVDGTRYMRAQKARKSSTGHDGDQVHLVDGGHITWSGTLPELMAAAGESDSQDHVSVAEQGYLHLMQGRAESELLEGDR